jgi:hypothetical protein
MLDMTAWTSLLGLLDECPILPAALTAILERRTTSVSPTAFDFISTTAQIGRHSPLHEDAPRPVVWLSARSDRTVDRDARTMSASVQRTPRYKAALIAFLKTVCVWTRRG